MRLVLSGIAQPPGLILAEGESTTETFEYTVSDELGALDQAMPQSPLLELMMSLGDDVHAYP